MDLQHYADVHPDWNIIESLDRNQSEATLDLLTLATVIDGDLTEEEVQTLDGELQELPFATEEAKPSVFAEELDKIRARMRTFAEDPERFTEYLDEACAKIDSEDIQMAVLRLLAIDVTLDEPTELQQELFYAVGRAWGFDFSTLENFLKSAWASHEETRDREHGHEHDVPPIKGVNWARDRTLSPHNLPFSQKMDT